MKRELREFNCEVVIGFKFLDTPGDEIAPGSNEVGKDFQHDLLCHSRLLLWLDSRFYVPRPVEVKGFRPISGRRNQQIRLRTIAPCVAQTVIVLTDVFQIARVVAKLTFAIGGARD
jgi:hypothetical protein